MTGFVSGQSINQSINIMDMYVNDCHHASQWWIEWLIAWLLILWFLFPTKEPGFPINCMQQSWEEDDKGQGVDRDSADFRQLRNLKLCLPELDQGTRWRRMSDRLGQYGEGNAGRESAETRHFPGKRNSSRQGRHVRGMANTQRSSSRISGRWSTPHDSPGDEKSFGQSNPSKIEKKLFHFFIFQNSFKSSLQLDSSTSIFFITSLDCQNFIPDHSRSSQITPDHSRPSQITPDHPKSSQITPDHPKSLQIIPDHRKSLQTIQSHPKSLQIIPDHPKSLQITPDHSRSSQIVPDHSRSFQILFRLIPSFVSFECISSFVARCSWVFFWLLKLQGG